jgi:PAS domain S-box-containing protein
VRRPAVSSGGRRVLVAVVVEVVVAAVAVAATWGSATASNRDLSRYGTAAAFLVSLVVVVLVWRLDRDRAPGRARGGTTGATADGGFDWTWSIDLDGTVVSSDAGVNMLLGYTTVEVMGKNLYRFVHARDRDQARRRVRQAVDDRAGWSDWVQRLVHRDGSDRWVQSSAMPTVSQAGTVVGFRGTAHDVTPTVLAERSDAARRDGLGAKRSRIQAILRNPTGSLRMVFQPIVAMDGSIVGVEALARFSAEPARRPDQWFAEAAEVGLGAELELLAVQVALDQLDRLPDGYLAVNLAPTTIAHPSFHELLDSPDTPCDRLVVELTEPMPIESYDELRTVLDAARARGVRITVDDAGAGSASFRHILELRPDLIKLDRAMVMGLGADPARQVLATALVDAARVIGATVVAEGVEDLAALSAVRAVGITLAQGYLFGAPGEPPITVGDFVASSDLRAIVIDADASTRLLVTGAAHRAGIEVVGEADGGDEGLRLAEQTKPDVVVLDANDHAMLPELRRAVPGAFIIVLSSTTTTMRRSAVMPTRADAYVAQDDVARRLPELFTAVIDRHAS